MISDNNRTISVLHPEGMLDRDLRTVRTHPFESLSSGRELEQEHLWTSTTPPTPVTVTALGKGTSGCRRSRKGKSRIRTIWIRRIVQRLQRVLLLSTYLLSAISLPRTSSAPASRNYMADRMTSHPKWINPCGMGNNEMMPHDGEAIVVSDGDLLNQIELQARIALSRTDLFKEDYVRNTFKTDFEQNHRSWKTARYDWLPSWQQIPKDLGEKIPAEHLESLELDKSLLDTYEYLQTIAVGLEQIVWDQEDNEGQFTPRFKEAEFKLRALLCEIQVAILERGLNMRPDVQRDIMANKYRVISSNSLLRDWIIFRDYMNALEYVIEVFDHLKKNL